MRVSSPTYFEPVFKLSQVREEKFCKIRRFLQALWKQAAEEKAPLRLKGSSSSSVLETTESAQQQDPINAIGKASFELLIS